MTYNVSSGTLNYYTISLGTSLHVWLRFYRAEHGCRMVSGVHQSKHITPVLEGLHWLPVSQWVVFKRALMVWKCVHGVTPAYLTDLCIPATAISGRQHLRSAANGTLLVPRTRTATGQRIFAVNGPATWNRLPPALRSPNLSVSTFKRALKTHLFSTTRHHWDVLMILVPDINIQTYLQYYHTVTHSMRLTDCQFEKNAACKNADCWSASAASLRQQ